MISRLLILFTLLTLVVFASSDRNTIPNPELMLESDSYSIAVVEFRGDDEAIKTLLEATLKSINSGEAKLPASMADVSDYLGRNNRADLLFAGLPFQGLRVDRMLPSGQTSPAYAFTLAGWKGLQSQLNNSLCTAPGGKPFPSQLYRTTDMVSRDHSDDPTWAATLCRAEGTFVFSPSLDQAKKVFDRLVPKDKPVGPAAGPLLTAFKALPKTPDGFGVMINQKGAFSALLKSMNNEHVQKVREKVGSDRLERVVANTKVATWQVEITSAERADLQVVLTLDPKDVAEAAAMLEDGKSSVDATKVVDISITPAGNTVTVKASVVGLKKLLTDALAKTGNS